MRKKIQYLTGEEPTTKFKYVASREKWKQTSLSTEKKQNWRHQSGEE